ncbi:hypothetical protein AVEN_172141-1 [Araneus ventricosus]|uniref:DDE Tnp4 domain-containing protein n=1 Tax=Araneus ventricosus TaxID=182803 RepID=A0A4Y2K2Y5_ARAVE|nr:hypothetical protein AVEN_172141-1 [Araneus ventricosus]
MSPPVFSRPLTFSEYNSLQLTLVKISKILAEEVIDAIDSEVNKPKRLWVKWIKRRNQLGASNLLLKELAVEDPAEYRLFLRMTPEVPSTENAWAEINKGFLRNWNFPNCYGAIDGKHVLIQAPPNSGSQFFNYKGFNSIILMALVNWDYSFIYIDVGCNGCVSDGGVFQNSSLYTKLEEGWLFSPAGCIIGDDAFPLKPYLMKPYKLCPLTTEQKIFNYRLSRARRVSENAFGILVRRFKILSRKIECQLQTTDKIVKASCALHNWLGKTSSKFYFAQGSLDEVLETGEVMPGRWRSEITELYNIQDIFGRHRRATKLAKQRRKDLTRFFNNEGAVPWQHSKIC